MPDPHTPTDESDPIPADELDIPEHRDHTLAGDCWCDPVVEMVAPI